MDRFLQLHILTSYPPANLNRDEAGRPKTAKMGGSERLRVSSQCLKRTWRISEVFSDAMQNHIGIRTKGIGRKVYDTLRANNISHSKALDWSVKIAGVFGATRTLSKDDKKKIDSDKLSQEEKEQLECKQTEIEQLVHVSPEELDRVIRFANMLAKESRNPDHSELQSLRGSASDAVDIALFGRMMAKNPDHNVDAACQVAHAVSVHPVAIENDYFTAVDDLRQDFRDDSGAAHIGECGFAAALFYSYICINRELLVENLQGDEQIADRAIQALTEATLKTSPSGKKNSFGSNALASYMLAEYGTQQPRSLSVAFLKPIDDHFSDHFIRDAILALRRQAVMFDSVYGACAERRFELCANADVTPAEHWPGGNFEGLTHFLKG